MSAHEDTAKPDEGATPHPAANSQLSSPGGLGPAQPYDPDRLVTGRRLLEILFEPESRPSMQWLRKQVHQRSIPFVRRGNKWWFRPRHVDEWFRQREQFPQHYKRA